MSLKKLRSYRIYNIAVFDIVASIIGLMIIFVVSQRKYWPKLNTKTFITAAILSAIPLGIIVHIIFGVDTQLNYTLGLSNKPNR